MKSSFLGKFSKCLLLGVILAPAALAQQIVVNEFYRAGNLTSGNEWVEVVLMVDLTAAQLDGFFIGDSTSSTATKFSGYKFTNMAAIAANFSAGTIITLAGTTGPAVDTTYDPAGGDWNITLKTAGGNITANGFNGDLAATDVVYVDTDGTMGNSTISANGFAVNWDSTPGTFGGNANITLSNSPNNNTGAFNSDNPASAATAANWTSDTVLGSLTPGAPNGGANSTAIVALQALFPVELMSFSIE